MDRIGVGDCQTHQVLWWGARIRNCIKEVEANGGFLESERINPALVWSIVEGEVSDLFLDRSSGLVLLSRPALNGARVPSHSQYRRYRHVQHTQLHQPQQQQQQRQPQQLQRPVFPPTAKPSLAPDPYGGIAGDPGGYGRPAFPTTGEYGGYAPSQIPSHLPPGGVHGQATAFPTAGVRPFGVSRPFGPSAAHTKPIYTRFNAEGERVPTAGAAPPARSWSPGEVPPGMSSTADAWTPTSRRSPTSRDPFPSGRIAQLFGMVSQAAMPAGNPRPPPQAQPFNTPSQTAPLAGEPNPPPPAAMAQDASGLTRDKGVEMGQGRSGGAVTAASTPATTATGVVSSFPHQQRGVQQKPYTMTRRDNYGSSVVGASNHAASTKAQLGVGTPPGCGSALGDLRQPGGIEPRLSQPMLEHQDLGSSSLYLEQQQQQQRQQDSRPDVCEGRGSGEELRGTAAHPGNGCSPHVRNLPPVKEEEKLESPSHTQDGVSPGNTTPQRKRVKKEPTGGVSRAIPTTAGQQMPLEADGQAEPGTAQGNTGLNPTAGFKASADVRPATMSPRALVEARQEKGDGAVAGSGAVANTGVAVGREGGTGKAATEKERDSLPPLSVFRNVKRARPRDGDGSTAIEHSLAEQKAHGAACRENVARGADADEAIDNSDDHGTCAGGDAGDGAAAHEDVGGVGGCEPSSGGDVVGGDDYGASVAGDSLGGVGASTLDISAAVFTPCAADHAATDDAGAVPDVAKKTAMSPRTEMLEAAKLCVYGAAPAPTAISKAQPPASALFEAVRAVTVNDTAVAAATAAATAARKPSTLAAGADDPGTQESPRRDGARAEGHHLSIIPTSMADSTAATAQRVAAAAAAPTAAKPEEAQAAVTRTPVQTASPPGAAAAPVGVPTIDSPNAEARPVTITATGGAAPPSPASPPSSPSSGKPTTLASNRGPSLPTPPQEAEARAGHDAIAPVHGSTTVRSVPGSCTPGATPVCPCPSAAPAAAAGPTSATEFAVVRDEQSMSEAITALGIGGKDTAEAVKVWGSGRLTKALKGAGPVAVRLSGRTLGMTNGAISTVQIAAGAVPTVLVLDVQSLLETPEGGELLRAELRYLLEDPTICKVMHNVHDQGLALARLVRQQGQGAVPCIRSLMDLELAHESLGGGLLNSLSDAPWSFGECDDPRRTISSDEATSARSAFPRTLDSELLSLAAGDVDRLRQSCKLARDCLVKAGKFAEVLKASQMKADFAMRAKRHGWRRMTFVDAGSMAAGNGKSAKILASYELQKVKKLSERPYRGADQNRGAGNPTRRSPSGGTTAELIPVDVPASTRPEIIPPTQEQDNKERNTDNRASAEMEAHGVCGHDEVPHNNKDAGVDANDAKALSPPRDGIDNHRNDRSDGSACASASKQGLLSPHEKDSRGKSGEDGAEKTNNLFGSFDCSGSGGGGGGGRGTASPGDGDPSLDRPEEVKGGLANSGCGLNGDKGTDSMDQGGGFGSISAVAGVERKAVGIERAEKKVHKKTEPQRKQHRQPGADRGDAASRDVLKMLQHLPKLFLKDVLAHSEVIAGLEAVVLDQGCRPRILVRGRGTVYLCKDPAVRVTRYHLNCVVGKLEHLGLFENDDTAGFDGLLHRVGVMRDKGGTINGATIRVGRYAFGVSDMADDLLSDVNTATGGRGMRPPSILVLGGHGAGKTNLLRDVCRKLSPCENVVVVDTRNEIGGEGVIPHREAIGEDTRRVMVPDDKDQHEVISQAYRNHNPQTLVVDEIMSQQDVDACLEIKARGVRVVAGALGNLPSVLDSHELGEALGGLEGVESWESEDDRSASTQERRAGKPLFDAVIELEGGGEGGRPPRWTVVTNVGDVVDELLAEGRVPRPEFRAPLGDDDLFDEVGGEGGEDGLEDYGLSTAFLLKRTRDETDSWLW